jgi:hypothetical protein
MASGAPLDATRPRRRAVLQAWLTASRPGVSGYSRTSDQPGCRCSVFLSSRSPGLVQRALHGIEGIALAGQDRVLEEPCNSSGAALRRSRGSMSVPAVASWRKVIWFWVSVPGLVDAQNRGGPQHLDRRHPSREHVAARDAPGAQRQEDGEHDRELLGQDGHGHRDAGEAPCFQTSAPPPRVSAKPPPRARRPPARDGEVRTTRPVSLLQHRRLGLTLLERLADLAELGACRPVATTSTMPWPAVTRVPENTEGRSSPPGRSRPFASAEATLRTGTDSPVKQRLVRRQVERPPQRPSAGTRSPSARTTRSPRTTSRPAMRRERRRG